MPHLPDRGDRLLGDEVLRARVQVQALASDGDGAGADEHDAVTELPQRADGLDLRGHGQCQCRVGRKYI